ncbi:hypothetical protein RJ639_013757 [Escallonia herrerae]|uniref:Glycosyltransferase n=1 Tax=Escallonia herrerae TaxID=1293975 RepID=A0AA88VLR4_9ASTE|nr:hypothetical protein RJ639_013757 [Escallonia herrerae]
MPVGDEKPVAGYHIVAMPYPGRGHINPMINLCTFLASKRGINITIVLTEEWLGLIGLAPGAPTIRLRTIPNVIPSEINRGDDFAGFIEAVFTKMEAPFDQLLGQLDLPASCIVADMVLPWMKSVGSRRNIPVVSLWPAAPSSFLAFYHSHLLAARGKHPKEDLPAERKEDIIDDPPRVSSVVKDTRIQNLMLKAFSYATKGQGLIFTSFYELEPHTINSLTAELHIPIYTIGPAIPYLSLKDPSSMSIPIYDEECFKWLDLQPEASVLYVSMGSFLSASNEQMHELSNGLSASGFRYLWVARDEAMSLPESCGTNGLVVPWCEQLRVLCHSSVGGFLTHCGWNSTMESIYAGIPMLTFPLAADQHHNCELIVEGWKIGLELKSNVGADNVVGREEISNNVKRLMDQNGEEGKQLRRRAKELQETCQRAIEKGGSTDCNSNAFFEDFVHEKQKLPCNVDL